MTKKWKTFLFVAVSATIISVALRVMELQPAYSLALAAIVTAMITERKKNRGEDWHYSAYASIIMVLLFIGLKP